MPDFNTMQRRRLAAKNQALPDGSFPIRNVADLKRAIQSYGRAKDKIRAKAWIIKRARALGATDLLPEGWISEDVLVHYGILGMKWGIRRFQDKSGRLTAAGKKRYDDDPTNDGSDNAGSKTKEVGDSFIEKKLGIKLSEKQKTALKVGAGVAAIALAAYGGYRLYNSDIGKPLRDQVDLFFNRFNESYDREFFKETGKLTQHSKKDLSTRDYDSKLRFFKKAREYTPEEDLKAINEGMFYMADKGARNNCGLCTTVYELRRRGYDVRANFSEQGRSIKTLSEFFKNADIQDDSALANRTKSEWMAAIEKRLLRQGEGARGNFGGQYAMGGGHSIIYEVSKGKVIFRDGQTGNTYRSVQDAIGNFVPGKSNYFRMDNLEINTDNIHNAASTFGLPRVRTNVMEHDPVQARAFRQAVVDYRRQYKRNTGYDLSLEAARNVIRKYYGVKV